ncbi:hypothetical protein SAMN04488515_1903 [Cognatiyoonia koreensis]|uniref:Uncharacterized protein n=1 Tax=Cognatiyoonia koreensis TaxID=364200 RepID=A0A1I0QHM5_9RHOB|nr:hypothetical protein SAMN04488515_1903 [Cognatiyoonia koreensis]
MTPNEKFIDPFLVPKCTPHAGVLALSNVCYTPTAYESCDRYSVFRRPKFNSNLTVLVRDYSLSGYQKNSAMRSKLWKELFDCFRHLMSEWQQLNQGGENDRASMSIIHVGGLAAKPSAV